MTKNKTFAAAMAFASAVTFSSVASATVFAVDYHDAGVWNAYDSQNEAYGARFRSDLGNDGFWLVVTDGDNPKGDGSSHAILYGDIENNRITAYTYDGENSSNSFQTGTLLGTYENAFSDAGAHHRYGYDQTEFSLDVSGINNDLGADFDGVVLGEQSGIWFHQSAGSQFTYGADGSITDFIFDNATYLDRGNDLTRNLGIVDCSAGESVTNYLNSCGSTQLASIGSPSGGANTGGGATGAGGGATGGGSVPAPGGLALILVGLAGLGRMRRRNKA